MIEYALMIDTVRFGDVNNGRRESPNSPGGNPPEGEDYNRDGGAHSRKKRWAVSYSLCGAAIIPPSLVRLTYQVIQRV